MDFLTAPQRRMAGYLAKVATGPRLSKDLAEAEAQDAIELLLDGACDRAQAAALLIALRMKGESAGEHRGALRALRGRARHGEAAVDSLIDIGDPYDGFSRHLPATPFLPAVLAACGLPAVSHGCRALPPKWGATVRAVLAAAGAPVEASVEAAARRIEDPGIGWAYVDVEAFCPALAALAELRVWIQKRPLLATLEKLMGPVRPAAGGRSCALVGFVHRGYDELLIDVARVAGYDDALAVRGVEGGVAPPLSGGTVALGYRDGGAAAALAIEPAALGVSSTVRAPPLPGGPAGEEEEAAPPDVAAIAAAAAAAGIAALAGAAGPTRDALVIAAAPVLLHLGRAASPAAAADRVRAVLDDGSARARFGV